MEGNPEAREVAEILSDVYWRDFKGLVPKTEHSPVREVMEDIQREAFRAALLWVRDNLVVDIDFEDLDSDVDPSDQSSIVFRAENSAEEWLRDTATEMKKSQVFPPGAGAFL